MVVSDELADSIPMVRAVKMPPIPRSSLLKVAQSLKPRVAKRIVDARDAAVTPLRASVSCRMQRLGSSLKASRRPLACEEMIERPRSDGPSLTEDMNMHMHWADALAGRSAKELPAEELRALVDVGIPLKYRHELWPRWFAKPNARFEGRHRPPAKWSAQIALDIPRSRTGWLNDAHRDSLEGVLSAYATRNPSIGYSQGMTFLASVFLLLGFDDAATYQGLCYLLEDVCPEYHGQDLEGYRRDVAVLSSLAQRLLPDVSRKLEELDVPLSLLSLSHFLTLTSSEWPLEAVVQLWDLILLEGSPAVFASFLALLELYVPSVAEWVEEPHFQAADAMDGFRQSVMRGCEKDLGKILEYTKKYIAAVPKSLIERLRRQTDGV